MTLRRGPARRLARVAPLLLLSGLFAGAHGAEPFGAAAHPGHGGHLSLSRPFLLRPPSGLSSGERDCVMGVDFRGQWPYEDGFTFAIRMYFRPRVGPRPHDPQGGLAGAGRSVRKDGRFLARGEARVWGYGGEDVTRARLATFRALRRLRRVKVIVKVGWAGERRRRVVRRWRTTQVTYMSARSLRRCRSTRPVVSPR